MYSHSKEIKQKKISHCFRHKKVTIIKMNKKNF